MVRGSQQAGNFFFFDLFLTRDGRAWEESYGTIMNAREAHRAALPRILHAPPSVRFPTAWRRSALGQRDLHKAQVPGRVFGPVIRHRARTMGRSQIWVDGGDVGVRHVIARCKSPAPARRISIAFLGWLRLKSNRGPPSLGPRHEP